MSALDVGRPPGGTARVGALWLPPAPWRRALDSVRSAPRALALTRRLRTDAWWAFLVVGAALAALWPLLPNGPGRLALYQAALLGAVAATAGGVLLHRPAHAHAWWFLSGALLVSTVRSVAVAYGAVLPAAASPWVDQGLRLAAGLLGLAFLVSAVRVWSSRSRNRDGFADAALVAAAALVALLAVLVQPARLRLDLETTVTALLALLLAVVASSLVRYLAARPRVPAAWLLLAGVATGTVATVQRVLAPPGSPGLSWDTGLTGWLLLVTVVLAGSVALHPSMAGFTSDGPLPTTDTTRARFAVLGAAVLTPPVATVLGADPDTPTQVLASAGVVLTLLVCWQMYRLVRARERDRALRDRIVDQQHVLLDLSHAALRMGRLGDALDEAVTVVARAVGPAWCALLASGSTPGLLVARAERDTGGEATGSAYPGDRAGDRRDAEARSPLTLPETVAGAAGRPHRAPLPVALEPETLAAVPALTARGIVSGVAVPVTTGGSCSGLLVVLFRERRELAEFEERFLTSVAGLVAGAVDRRREEEQARHDSLHDPLTGLANRRLLLDRLSAAVERARSGGRHSAAVFVDLDGFKAVNDTWGHAVGDEVLRQVARRLALVPGEGGIAARLSGDEFVLVLADGPDGAAGHAAAAEVARCLAEPVVAHGVELALSASVGVALTSDLAASADPVHDLLATADAAMYRTKHGVPGRTRHDCPHRHHDAVAAPVARVRDAGAADRASAR